jgi:PAS domain S-box-containing protein
MKLDPQTITFAFLLISAVLGGLLLFTWWLNRRVTALAWWGLAFWLVVGGLSVAALQLGIPQASALVVGNALAALAYAFLYTGCRAFNSRPVWVPALLAGPVLWLLAWRFISDWQSARTILMSLIVSAYCSAAAWELWRHAPAPLRFQSFAIWLIAGNATFYMLRSALVASGSSAEWLSGISTRWSTETALFFLVYAPALAFVFLAMAKERADQELKQDAQSVEESEVRYRALIEASTSIFWRASPDGSILEAHGWEAYSGQVLDAFRGTGWLEAVHPDEREGAASFWRAVLASGKAGEQEFRVRSLKGAYRWVISRAVPVRSPDGSIGEWVGTLTDIQEQKVAEAARSEANLRLAAALRAGRMMAWDWDFVTGEVTRSDTALDVLGLPSGSITNFLDRIHDEDQALYQAAIETATQESGTYDVEYRFHKPDGHLVWLRETGQIDVSPDGKPLRARGLVFDISDRRRLEAQLRQSQKMEAMGQLTGGVAHDFNNLLTVIIGNTEVLSDTLTDPQQRAMANMVLDAAERGAVLNEQLLSFARRQALKPEPLDPYEVVHGMLGLLKRTLGEHIEIRTVLSTSKYAALIDRTQFGNALLNLAVNARDAMPQGGTLTISTGERAAGPDDGDIPMGQPVVFVSVSDTGSGMPPEVLARAFEPFFTTKDVGKGSGLGLSMVYGFAQQSGGHVTIRSQEGQGTTVTILLRAVNRGSSAAEPLRDEAVPRGQERVLLVEDEPSVRKFVASQLRSLGYDVKVAENGPEALRMLEQGQAADLLFTDVVLPQGMSGVELTRRARNLDPTLKVLLTSGYSEEVFEQHGRLNDQVPLLRKPYRRKELAEALRRVLEDGSKN